MTVLQITLSDLTSARLNALAQQTGQTPDALTKAAVEQLVSAASAVSDQGPELTAAVRAAADDHDGTAATNGAVDPSPVSADMPAWQAALMQGAHIWKDRDGIPELMAGLWRRPDPSQDPADLPDWKAALMQAAGMWRDRDDIPELMAQLRREWGHVQPPDEAS